MLDPVLLLSIAALGGAAIAAAPVPAMVAAIGVAIAVGWRTRRPLVLAACGLVFAAQAARSIVAVSGARALHARSVAAFTPPAVCVARAVIVESPIASVRAAAGGSRDPEAVHPHANEERALGALASEEGVSSVRARAAVRVEKGSCDERPIPEGTVVRVYDLPDDLRRGDAIDVTAKLLPVHLFEHAELGSPWPSIARSEVVASGAAMDVALVSRPLSLAGAIDAARAFVRRRILATYAPEASGLARALVLGETDLAEDDVNAFRDSGLLHLLAVSGTHLVLVVSALAGVLRRALVRVEAVSARIDAGRPAACAGIAIAWIYADFAGGSGSAVRAAAMLSAALFARALGRRATPGRSLSLGLFGAAIADPLCLLDVSFSLSAGATAGLVVLGGPFGERVTSWVDSLARPSRKGDRALPSSGRGLSDADRPTSRWNRLLLGGLRHVLLSVATTLAATVGSTPAMLRLSPRLPVLGVLANIAAAPLGELVALPVCLAHAVTAPLGPLEKALALAGSGALLAVRGIAKAASSIGGGLNVPPPTPMQLAALAAATALFATARDRRSRQAVIALATGVLLLLEHGQRRAGAPRDVLRISALDVGQGDSILIDFPDGRSMLVDGGGMVGNPVDPGTRVILPVLAARRRSSVDVLSLTHPHPDHFTGLATVAANLPFGELWESGQGEMQGAKGPYAALLSAARAKGAPVRRSADLCGEPRFFGRARVEVMWPCPAVRPETPANDASLVMRIDFGRRSALLVGDAEHEAERALLDRGTPLRADLLKVGHHGSRTSSSAPFLRAVSPGFALVSCGVRNRFGHPHPEALSRLAGTSALVLRTDRGGEIVWSTDGDDVWVERP